MAIQRHPLLTSVDAPGVRADGELLLRLERSARLLGDCATTVVPRFYAGLFRRCPELRHLFPEDPTRLAAQQAKVGASLAAVIVHLRQPEALARPLRELGARHADYGARDEHYPIVVEELVTAMAEAGGAAWSEEDSADWRTALHVVAELMIEGARAARHSAAASSERSHARAERQSDSTVRGLTPS